MATHHLDSELLIDRKYSVNNKENQILSSLSPSASFLKSEARTPLQESPQPSHARSLSPRIVTCQLTPRMPPPPENTPLEGVSGYDFQLRGNQSFESLLNRGFDLPTSSDYIWKDTDYQPSNLGPEATVSRSTSNVITSSMLDDHFGIVSGIVSSVPKEPLSWKENLQVKPQQAPLPTSSVLGNLELRRTRASTTVTLPSNFKQSDTASVRSTNEADVQQSYKGMKNMLAFWKEKDAATSASNSESGSVPTSTRNSRQTSREHEDHVFHDMDPVTEEDHSTPPKRDFDAGSMSSYSPGHIIRNLSPLLANINLPRMFSRGESRRSFSAQSNDSELSYKSGPHDEHLLDYQMTGPSFIDEAIQRNSITRQSNLYEDGFLVGDYPFALSKRSSLLPSNDIARETASSKDPEQTTDESSLVESPIRPKELQGSKNKVERSLHRVRSSLNLVGMASADGSNIIEHPQNLSTSPQMDTFPAIQHLSTAEKNHIEQKPRSGVQASRVPAAFPSDTTFTGLLEDAETNHGDQKQDPNSSLNSIRTRDPSHRHCQIWDGDDKPKFDFLETPEVANQKVATTLQDDDGEVLEFRTTRLHQITPNPPQFCQSAEYRNTQKILETQAAVPRFARGLFDKDVERVNYEIIHPANVPEPSQAKCFQTQDAIHPVIIPGRSRFREAEDSLLADQGAGDKEENCIPQTDRELLEDGQLLSKEDADGVATMEDPDCGQNSNSKRGLQRFGTLFGNAEARDTRSDKLHFSGPAPRRKTSSVFSRRLSVRGSPTTVNTKNEGQDSSGGSFRLLSSSSLARPSTASSTQREPWMPAFIKRKQKPVLVVQRHLKAKKQRPSLMNLVCLWKSKDVGSSFEVHHAGIASSSRPHTPQSQASLSKEIDGRHGMSLPRQNMKLADFPISSTPPGKEIGSSWSPTSLKAPTNVSLKALAPSSPKSSVAASLESLDEETREQIRTQLNPTGDYRSPSRHHNSPFGETTVRSVPKEVYERSDISSEEDINFQRHPEKRLTTTPIEMFQSPRFTPPEVVKKENIGLRARYPPPQKKIADVKLDVSTHANSSPLKRTQSIVSKPLKRTESTAGRLNRTPLAQIRI